MDRNEKVIRSGQVSAYCDEVYELEFSAIDEVDALLFLDIEKKINLKNRVDNDYHHTGRCGFPFGLETFYSIRNIGGNRWRYTSTSPYCD